MFIPCLDLAIELFRVATQARKWINFAIELIFVKICVFVIYSLLSALIKNFNILSVNYLYFCDFGQVGWLEKWRLISTEAKTSADAPIEA